MPPKATPGPTWPYQCTLDKSQLAKGINSSHCLLSKVFRSKFSPKILITFSSHRDVGFNCVSPVCSHCCSLNCIHCMFCLSVACSTFHCPSPPIPSHFPALNTSQCILHTADGALHPSCTTQCVHTVVHVAAHHIPRYPILRSLHLKTHNVQLIRSCSVARTAEQICGISARSKPFPRLRR